MGTMIGALLGTACLMLLARRRGRDSTGLAAGTFVVAVVVGILLSVVQRLAGPQIPLVTPSVTADEMSGLLAVFSGAICFGVAFLPGAVLVLLPNQAPKAEN